MKILLVFLVFFPSVCQSTDSEVKINYKINASAFINILPKQSILGLIQPNAADHPILEGETAREPGGGEHAVPLLFIVIAFTLTLVAGFIWVERGVQHSGKLHLNLLVFAAVFVILNAVLLDALKLDKYKHHFEDIIWSGIAFIGLIVLIIILNRIKQPRFIIVFLFSIPQLVIILILLNFFHRTYFKICNNNCVMRGSQAGNTFDLPCSDNIAFMALHHTEKTNVMDYLKDYETAKTLPLGYL